MTQLSHANARTMSRLREIHVETERDLEFRNQLERLFEVDASGKLLPTPIRFTAGLETRGIAFIEPAGGGKTTAIRRVLAETEVLRNNPETDAPRFVHAQISSPATQKSLGVGILSELGIDRVSDRAKVWEIWGLVRRRLEIMGISVLWIDEAHDLFLSRSPREIDDMLKMLKSLMQGDGAVVVVLSGTERLFEIASYDPQVDRRFTKILPGDLEIGADNANVEGLVRNYCEEAGLKFRPQRALIGRLIFGSRKRFGRVVETTIHAIECALREGANTLRIEHFCSATSPVTGQRHRW